MIKRLFVLAILISTAVCEMYTLGGFKLLSTISEAQSACESMELIEDKGFSRHYSAFNNDNFNWKLLFQRNNEGEFYLSQILMISYNRTYSEFVEVSNEFSKIQGRYPDVTDTSGKLPWYSTNWNTEYTHFSVMYGPDQFRLTIRLSVAY